MSENLFESLTLSNGKSVEFKNSWTRKMDKEYSAILYKDVKRADENSKSRLSFESVELAEEYIIKSITNLSQKEIDELEVKDYGEVQKRANAIFKHLKSGS